VRHIPKGMDNGGAMELTEGGGGQWPGGGSLVGRRGHETEEKVEGSDGVVRHALAREDEREKKRGGAAAMEHNL
jgi:hypothetical protein